MKIPQHLALTLFFVGIAVRCPAQLAWDNKSLEFRPALTDTNVVARFIFKNGGSYPVTILNIKPSCDCTISEPPKKAYKPGEKGEITANYSIQEHAGAVETFLTVQTDDKKDPFTRLTFHVQVHELFKATPRVLSWKTGEKAGTKKMDITMVDGVEAVISGVHPNDPGMKVEVNTVKPGKEYALLVTPFDTNKTGLTVLTIETSLKGQKARTCYGYVLIK